MKSSENIYGFSIKETAIKDKRKSLRNLVNPEIGLHLLEQAQDKEYNIFRGEK